MAPECIENNFSLFGDGEYLSEMKEKLFFYQSLLRKLDSLSLSFFKEDISEDCTELPKHGEKSNFNCFVNQI